MTVVLDSPAWARVDLPEARREELDRLLTYKDLQVDFEVRRMKRGAHRLRSWMGEEAYDDKLAGLVARARPTLVRSEDGGPQRVPAGLARYAADHLRVPLVDERTAPEPRALPWANPLRLEPRPYQLEGVEKLLEHRHGCLELGTGAGKTLLAVMACQRLGLQAVVAAPYSTIVQQTYREMVHHLGKSRVGLYGDGKHDVGKLVTVATAQALQKVDPTSRTGEFFSQTQVWMADEAHLFAAKTLESLNYGLFGQAPYRFFLTGTHLRGDGRQQMLQGITGDVLLQRTVEDLVGAGYLARPAFRMVLLEGGVEPLGGAEPDKTTRRCLYRSPRVVATVADLVNRLCAAGRPTLVLVDELDQFAALLPRLRYAARFAFGGLPGDPKAREKAKAKIPKEHQVCDPLELVEQFNAGKFPVLVGTSCITTGADVRAAAGGVWWRGGRSEVDLRQGVGRYVRLAPGKTDAVIFDLDVVDGGVCHSQARARKAIYEEIYPDYEEISMLRTEGMSFE